MDNELTYDLFSELNVTIPTATVEFIKTFIENANKNNTWIWPSTTLPNTYLLNNELRKIDFGPVINDFFIDWAGTLTILKVPPNSYVPWHIDVILGRRCVINVPLTLYPNSVTLVTNAPVPDTNLCKDIEYNTFKMPYLMDKVYLLNSQKYHSVFNFDTDIRYVISFCSEFLNYQEACKYFKDKELINRQW
jgi:hypothetical protein